MKENLIVMPGVARLDLQTLRPVAEEFGLDVKTAHDLSSAVAEADHRTAALLFHRSAVGSSTWIEAARVIKVQVPEISLIACHSFSEPIDWPSLCDAGAFHALWLPLKENEVRKSLGFVSQNRKRLAIHLPADLAPWVRPRAAHHAQPLKAPAVRALRAG